MRSKGLGVADHDKRLAAMSVLIIDEQRRGPYRWEYTLVMTAPVDEMLVILEAFRCAS